MKQLLMFCLIAYAGVAMAQKEMSENIQQVLKSQKFAFLATKVEKKPGTNGSSGYNFDVPNYSNVNPSTASIQTSLSITSQDGRFPVAETDRYYRLASGDGSYFTAYNINNKISRDKKLALDGKVFLAQNESTLQLGKITNKEIDYQLLTTPAFKVKSIKQKKNKTIITYKIKNGDFFKTVFLEVDQDGNAIFQDEATADSRLYVYGHIVGLK